jgi:hypothetical protein
MDKLPRTRPDFPEPSDANRLLYIQRSMNSNTVVMTAHFRSNGMLDPQRPIDVFWRRFNTNGKRKALSFFENQFAFGVRVKKTGNPNEFEVRFKVLPGRPFLLRQVGAGKAALFLTIGKYLTNPVYLYLKINGNSMIPKVDGLKIHAIDVTSGKAVTETLSVKGGFVGDGKYNE